MGEYIERKPMPGELFSKLKLKCPVNTKAAIIYNDFLRHKNLHVKYPEFTIGDKMYIAILKPNPYQIEVIPFHCIFVYTRWNLYRVKSWEVIENAIGLYVSCFRF